MNARSARTRKGNGHSSGWQDPRRALSARYALIRAQLLRVNAASVSATYDGGDDIGQIDCLQVHRGNGATIALPDDSNNALKQFLGDLIAMRYIGWTEQLGAFGEIRWDLASGDVKHIHHARYQDFTTDIMAGFDDLLEAPRMPARVEAKPQPQRYAASPIALCPERSAPKRMARM